MVSSATWLRTRFPANSGDKSRLQSPARFAETVKLVRVAIALWSPNVVEAS
jgi:hypothetical protein